VIIRSSVSPFKKEEIEADNVKDMKRNFTVELNERLQNKLNESEQSETIETMNYDKYSIPIQDTSPSFVEYEDNENDDFKLREIDEEMDQVEFDKYINIFPLQFVRWKTIWNK